MKAVNKKIKLEQLWELLQEVFTNKWIPGSDDAVYRYNRLICGEESDLWRPHLYPIEVRKRYIPSKKQLLMCVSASGVKATRIMTDRAYYEILDMIQPNQLALALTVFDPDKSLKLDWIVITV